MKLPLLDIYQQKNILQVFIGINLALIGIVSLFYTYNIVENIDKREQQQLKLYAQLLEYSANHAAEENTEDFTTLIEIVDQNIIQSRIPYLLVTEDNIPIDARNIDLPDSLKHADKQRILNEEFASIKDQHPPIVISISGIKQYIYFGNSPLLRQMRYYPYIQLLSLLVLAVLAYLVFSSSRSAEQNRVWVGLAKETAHQLGTPIASMMGWVELFRSMPEQYSDDITNEIEKDVKRLETITTRFSSIGSVPVMKDEDIAELVGPFLIYLQRRISTKVKITFLNELPLNQTARLNRSLFEWVIENLCKNAVDAMSGIGSIEVLMVQIRNEIFIDITDTGKGILKKSWKKVFNPGFSTKKRGWGLGLTLAKRIIEEYHGGKLYIKNSEIDKGTTFRIILKT
jgi:signal transduction histidine kinase